MSQIKKRFIPTMCPGCDCPTLSDEFYCPQCASERREQRELDEEFFRAGVDDEAEQERMDEKE